MSLNINDFVKTFDNANNTSVGHYRPLDFVERFTKNSFFFGEVCTESGVRSRHAENFKGIKIIRTKVKFVVNV